MLKPQLLTSLKNYNKSYFGADLFAGVTVGIVALPLAMAFAIASGVGPERGLFTAIVAGCLVSLLGGSTVQIGGPTGAFVLLVSAIVAQHGYDGLVCATIMAGILLIVLGLGRLGTMIKFVPFPVTTGFTTGIALVIFSTQIKDFLGLRMEAPPAELEAPVVIVAGDLAASLPAGFENDYKISFYGLRPDIQLVTYVERELWQEFARRQEHLAPGRVRERE